jgi:hypothetical protein
MLESGLLNSWQKSVAILHDSDSQAADVTLIHPSNDVLSCIGINLETITGERPAGPFTPKTDSAIPAIRHHADVSAGI